MDLHEIVKKLVGEINPIGETNQDDERYENLMVMADLAEKLLVDIEKVRVNNQDSCEFSVKRASLFAKKTLYHLGVLE